MGSVVERRTQEEMPSYLSVTPSLDAAGYPVFNDTAQTWQLAGSGATRIITNGVTTWTLPGSGYPGNPTGTYSVGGHTDIIVSAATIGVGGTVSANVVQIAGQATAASGTVTFPAATLASTTNITAGAMTAVTTLTNLPAIPNNWLTAAGIAAAAMNGRGDWNTTTPPTTAGIAAAILAVPANLLNTDSAGAVYFSSGRELDNSRRQIRGSSKPPRWRNAAASMVMA